MAQSEEIMGGILVKGLFIRYGKDSGNRKVWRSPRDWPWRAAGTSIGTGTTSPLSLEGQMHGRAAQEPVLSKRLRGGYRSMMRMGGGVKYPIFSPFPDATVLLTILIGQT